MRLAFFYIPLEVDRDRLEKGKCTLAEACSICDHKVQKWLL